MAIFKDLEDLEKRRKEFICNQIEILEKKIPNEKIIKSLDSIVIQIVSALNSYDINDKRVQYFINLLEKSLMVNFHDSIFSSDVQILKNLDIDEIDILKKLKSKSYSFIEKMDLIDGRFKNQEWKEFGFPKHELLRSDKFNFFIDNLSFRFHLLKWTYSKQVPIEEQGNQTGIMQYSNLYLTDLGISFINNILPNEN